MIALSDIIILTVSSALLVVALMRAYSPDNTDNRQNTAGQVQQQPATTSNPLQSSQEQTTQGQTTQGQTGQGQNGNPALTSGTSTAPADNTAQTSSSGSNQAQQPVAETPSATPAPTPEIVLESYTVQSGDSLSLIASRTGTSVRELQEINRLTSTVIQIGQILRYPAP